MNIFCLFHNYFAQFHLTLEYEEKIGDLQVQITHLVERVNDAFKKNEIYIKLAYHCHVLLNVAEETEAYEPNSAANKGAIGVLRRAYKKDG